MERTELGPYPVMSRDPEYSVTVGHKMGSYWYRVQEANGTHVDGAGLDGELTTLESLLSHSWVYCSWDEERTLIDELRRVDPALTSAMPEITALLRG